MHKKPLLTIGIPAYNVELYLEETILSIVRTKYQNLIEILIINDGSTDETLEVSERLALQYSSVKVINKTNGGHGSAINSAIQHATGKYFRLLDGDDWFDTMEFDKYLEKLQNETSDIVFTDLMECFIKTGLKRPVSYYSHLPEYTKLQLDDMVFPEWGPMLPTTTIKTKLLKDFNLKIDENCFYVDQEYNLACYLAAKNAIYYPFMIYQYRLEREGQSMEKTSLIRNVNSHETVCKRLLSIYKKFANTLSPTRQQYLSSKVIVPMCHMQYMIAIEWCKSRKHFLSFDNALKKYPNFYNNPGIAGTLTNFHRKTKGLFIKFDTPIRNLAEKRNRPKKSAKCTKRRVLILVSCLIPLIITNLIAINYVNTEQTIHYWDTSAYWRNSIDLLNTFNENKFDALKTVVDSMHTDYNLLPVLPVIPFLAIFGTSRLSFVLIILNLYILPFAIVMTKTIQIAFRGKYHHLKYWVYPLIFSIFLLSPALLIPVFNGRPDAICILILSLIFYLIAKTRMQYISNYFTLGLLTFLLIIFRRYFCFLAIGLYLAIFIVKTIISIHQYGLNKNSFLKIIKLSLKLFASGILILALMLIFSRSLLARYLTNNYSDAYSAYMMGDFLRQVILFIRYYGLIFLIMVIAGIIISYIKYHKTPVGELTSIGLISSTIVFLLFAKVQTLGDQHMYMFVPFFTFCIAVLVVYLHNLKKYCFLAILPIIIIIFISIYSFTGTRANSCSAFCYFIGISETVRPTVRHDMEKLNELTNYLENNMQPKDYVYVLSSSNIFNDDILKNLSLPSYPSFNISGVMHVDKRDGFPYYFFDASYIIVADPIQTHLTDGGQDVITYLANQIIVNQPSNLSLINTYSLDNNVTLKLYHKDTKYSDGFLNETKQYFENKYPDHPFLYSTIPSHDQ